MAYLSRVKAGTKELATTAAAALSAGQDCRSVAVQNDPNNLVDVLVGDADSQVWQLVPGDSVVLSVTNVSMVYAKNVSSTTQSVNWLAIY